MLPLTLPNKSLKLPLDLTSKMRIYRFFRKKYHFVTLTTENNDNYQYNFHLRICDLWLIFFSSFYFHRDQMKMQNKVLGSCILQKKFLLFSLQIYVCMFIYCDMVLLEFLKLNITHKLSISLVRTWRPFFVLFFSFCIIQALTEKEVFYPVAFSE